MSHVAEVGGGPQSSGLTVNHWRASPRASQSVTSCRDLPSLPPATSGEMVPTEKPPGNHGNTCQGMYRGQEVRDKWLFIVLKRFCCLRVPRKGMCYLGEIEINRLWCGTIN